jgi:hypothetical protein
MMERGPLAGIRERGPLAGIRERGRLSKKSVLAIGHLEMDRLGCQVVGICMSLM